MVDLANSINCSKMRELYPVGEATALCVHENTGKLYIKKVLPSEYAPQYRLIAGIDNAHIPEITLIEEDETKVSVYRPYLSGDTLQELLDKGSFFTIEEAVDIVLLICDALSALHEVGIIHRDVTPKNVLVSEDGAVRLIDFGISRTYKSDGIGDTVIMGTPGYAAPEQFGFAQSDPRTDIYAVGVMLNVMVTGELPSVKVVDGAPGEIIKKCISIDATNRFPDVLSLRRALCQICGKDAAAKSLPKQAGGLDGVFSQIPGMRSKHAVLCMISAALYALLAVTMIGSFTNVRPMLKNYILESLSWVMMAVIPLFCFGNMMSVRDRLPFIKNSSERSKRIFFYSLGALSTVVGMVLYASV